MKPKPAPCLVRSALDIWRDAYQSQVRSFLLRAESGIRCGATTRKLTVTRAAYSLHAAAGSLRVTPTALGLLHQTTTIHLENILNIWVHGDNVKDRAPSPIEMLFRVLEVQLDQSELSGLMLLETPAGTTALVERGYVERERFLECVAVLIATLQRRTRLREMRRDTGRSFRVPKLEVPRVVEHFDVWGFGRPEGTSLTSLHLTGAAGARLAFVGGPLLPDYHFA